MKPYTHYVSLMSQTQTLIFTTGKVCERMSCEQSKIIDTIKDMNYDPLIFTHAICLVGIFGGHILFGHTFYVQPGQSSLY